MALPVIANTVRVTWEFKSYLGVTPRIVQHYRTATANMSDLGAAIWNNAADGIFGPMHESFEPEALALLPLNGTSATTIVANPFPSDSNLCNGTGQIMPAVAALMTWRTLLRGPRGRGRSYIGPVVESAVSDGVLDEPWLSDLEDAWTATLGALSGEDPSISLCVASYVHEESTVVASGRSVRTLATQRRRQDQLR